MKYLIIGGGPCADAAAKEIRKGDKEAEIRIITEEWFPPYRRLSLTKQAWDVPFENISLKTEDQNVIIECGLKAVDIDPKKKIVSCISKHKKYNLVDEVYTTFEYDKLLIATGISPRQLNFGEYIIYLRTYSDLGEIKKVFEDEKHPDILLIGAGFTGLELACELTKRGANVTMVYPEDLPCRNVLPLDFCIEIVETFRKNKVSMISRETIKSLTYDSKMGKYNSDEFEGYNVVLESGRELKHYYNGVIASVGNIPNVPFPEKIDNDRGIIVNEFLETNIKDVYAAGDVAVFPSKHFGRNMRKEFMDNAIKSGKCAGQNMLGNKTEYDPIINTFFDAFDMSYKAVGEYGMNMDVSYKKVDEGSVIFYREDNVIKGIVFWKVKPALAMATTIIKDKLTLSDDEYLYMMKFK